MFATQTLLGSFLTWWGPDFVSLLDFVLSAMDKIPLSVGGEAGPSNLTGLDLNQTPAPEPEPAPAQVPDPAEEERIRRENIIARIREKVAELIAALEEEDRHRAGRR